MKITAVCISEQKGTIKKNVGSCEVISTGLKGDAHAGDWHRQVSLLAEESIAKMKNLGYPVTNGSFAENLTTEGIELYKLPIGTRLQINDVILEITQIGKECHEGCAIKVQTGKCVMPKEGVFAKVIKEGVVHAGDTITILK
jgi:molybdopterin adenylyltransferase